MTTPSGTPFVTGQRLNMKLGFSHSVYVPIPDHVKVEVATATKIMVSCVDKQKLGLFAARIRKWRPPEPYKGKVRYYGSLLWQQFLMERARV